MALELVLCKEGQNESFFSALLEVRVYILLTRFGWGLFDTRGPGNQRHRDIGVGVQRRISVSLHDESEARRDMYLTW